MARRKEVAVVLLLGFEHEKAQVFPAVPSLAWILSFKSGQTKIKSVALLL
jgi:hypothetical protein